MIGDTTPPKTYLQNMMNQQSNYYIAISIVRTLFQNHFSFYQYIPNFPESMILGFIPTIVYHERLLLLFEIKLLFNFCLIKGELLVA